LREYLLEEDDKKNIWPKGRELREYLLEEDAKKNIWPQEWGGNKKLEKISKDLLNSTSGQILLG